MKIRFVSAAFIATISLATFAAGPVFAATSPAMQACSKQWSDMKKANKVPEGEKWSEFWSQCSKDYAAKNGGDTGAGEAASTEKTTKPKKTTAVSEDDSATSAQQKKTATPNGMQTK